MENATKALMIAAAVLVAILIISLGIGVFNMASESMSGVDMDQYEIQAFNQKFTQYLGEKERGSKVNGLLTEVFNHNLKETDDGKKVILKVDNSERVSKSVTTAPKKVDTGKTYSVSANYAKSGLINEIIVTTIAD